MTGTEDWAAGTTSFFSSPFDWLGFSCKFLSQPLNPETGDEVLSSLSVPVDPLLVSFDVRFQTQSFREETPFTTSAKHPFPLTAEEMDSEVVGGASFFTEELFSTTTGEQFMTPGRGGNAVASKSNEDFVVVRGEVSFRLLSLTLTSPSLLLFILSFCPLPLKFLWCKFCPPEANPGSDVGPLLLLLVTTCCVSWWWVPEEVVLFVVGINSWFEWFLLLFPPEEEEEEEEGVALFNGIVSEEERVFEGWDTRTEEALLLDGADDGRREGTREAVSSTRERRVVLSTMTLAASSTGVTTGVRTWIIWWVDRLGNFLFGGREYTGRGFALRGLKGTKPFWLMTAFKSYWTGAAGGFHVWRTWGG